MNKVENATPVAPLDPMEGLIKCAKCDLAQLQEGSSSVTGYYGDNALWCGICIENRAQFCDACEEYFDSSVEFNNVENQELCRSCTSDCAHWCSACDMYEFDSTTCPNAGPELHNYSYKPRTVFYVGENESLMGAFRPRCYGIELEMENVTTRSDMRDALGVAESELGNAFYAKEDGSLLSGMELVSHPRSLASWNALAPELQDVLRQMSSLGMRAWTQSRCGLHIHVGWEHFTPSHAMRFALLFARNETEWVNCANRTSGYANFRALQAGLAMKVKNTDWAGHTDAINLGSNGGKTIEVRIFRPSLAVGRILGSIELVDSAVEYTKNMTAHEALNGGLDFENYAEFVKSSDLYPNAVRIINNQKFNLNQGE